jgi:hypothetical protein
VLGLLDGNSYHDHVVIPFKPDLAAGQSALLVFEAEYLKSIDAVHRCVEECFCCDGLQCAYILFSIVEQ